MPKTKKPIKAKRLSHTVLVTTVVKVEFDPSIMPDDDWRKQFYKHIKTPRDLAQFFAFNFVANGLEYLSEIDGFANLDDDLMLVERLETETEVDD